MKRTASVDSTWSHSDLFRYGFHCSHEQLPPSTLLRLATLAGKAGFAAGMCSDHFHPWSDRQGQSGFPWSWLGAALQATTLSFGTVCAPGQRYHPAVIAQAAATLSEMFPDRFWLAVGVGKHSTSRSLDSPGHRSRNALPGCMSQSGSCVPCGMAKRSRLVAGS
jgi:alkanesulfonate monooxygenase SsuD/methylene tetrahydromethanopterin reductase-like flavin-dependent oxidoreductase (luciferase family)